MPGLTSFLLPPQAYTSPDWWAEEQTTLFQPQWALVGSLEELTESGDYITATVGRSPLVVVRDGRGQLRAHHNMCRHRGMRLLDGCGQVRTLSCFYHQWRYALDGSLTTVPQRREQFPDLAVEDWGLLPASVAVWEGMVFAHPDPEAPPLSSVLDPVAQHLGSFRPGRLRQAPTARVEAKCNWKLFVENHVDVYHLWYLHAESLGDFDHTRFEYQQVGPNWVSYEPARSTVTDGDRLRAGGVEIAHLDDRDRQGLGAHLLFPNLMMATAAEFFATYVAQPVAPDRTVVELRVRVEEGADEAAVVESVLSFIREDVAACEAVQAAVSSPAFAVGPLAQGHEAPITSFHTHLLAALGRPIPRDALLEAEGVASSCCAHDTNSRRAPAEPRPGRHPEGPSTRRPDAANDRPDAASRAAAK